ncbi:MAG: hypothetical protein LBU08_02300, partial [Tannerellaceae bacterium]|nr:hypothetical protein [Tannerellaceae bacterium]
MKRLICLLFSLALLSPCTALAAGYPFSYVYPTSYGANFVPTTLPYDIPPTGFRTDYDLGHRANYQYPPYDASPYYTTHSSLPFPQPLVLGQYISFEVFYCYAGDFQLPFPDSISDVSFIHTPNFSDFKWYWTPRRTIFITAKYSTSVTFGYVGILSTGFAGIYLRFTMGGVRYGLQSITPPSSGWRPFDPFGYTNFLYIYDDVDVSYDITTSYDYVPASYKKNNHYDNTPPKVFLHASAEGRHRYQLYSEDTDFSWNAIYEIGFFELPNIRVPIGYKELTWTSSNPEVAYFTGGNSNPSGYQAAGYRYPNLFPPGGTDLHVLKAGSTVLSVSGINQFGQSFTFSKSVSFPNPPQVGRSEFYDPYKNLLGYQQQYQHEQQDNLYIYTFAHTSPYTLSRADGSFSLITPNYRPIDPYEETEFTIEFQLRRKSDGAQLNFPPSTQVEVFHDTTYFIPSDLNGGGANSNSLYRSFKARKKRGWGVEVPFVYYKDPVQPGPLSIAAIFNIDGRSYRGTYGDAKGLYIYGNDTLLLWHETDEFFFVTPPLSYLNAAHALHNEHNKIKFHLQAFSNGVATGHHPNEEDPNNSPHGSEHLSYKPVGVRNLTWRSNNMDVAQFYAGAGSDILHVLSYGQTYLDISGTSDIYTNNFLAQHRIDIAQPPQMKILPELFGKNTASFIRKHKDPINKDFDLQLTFSNERTYPPRYSPFTPIWYLNGLPPHTPTNNSATFIGHDGVLHTNKPGFYTVTVAASRRSFTPGGDGTTFFYPLTRDVVITEDSIPIFSSPTPPPSLFVGESRQLPLQATLSGFPYYLDNPQWTSSNPQVASIDNNEFLTALSSGETTLAFSAVGEFGRFSCSFSLAVSNLPTATILPKPFSGNDYLFLPLHTSPDDYTTISAAISIDDKPVTFPYQWIVRLPNMLRIDADDAPDAIYGKLHTRQKGATYILFEVLDPLTNKILCSDRRYIAIFDPEKPPFISFLNNSQANSDIYRLDTGAVDFFTASAQIPIAYSNNFSYAIKDFTWTSSNSSVASITPLPPNQLRIDAHKPGLSTITTHANGQLGPISAQFTLLVNEPQQVFPPTPAIFSLGFGQDMDKELHVTRSRFTPNIPIRILLSPNLAGSLPQWKVKSPSFNQDYSHYFFHIESSGNILSHADFAVETQATLCFHSELPLDTFPFLLIASHPERTDLSDSLWLFLYPPHIDSITLALDGLPLSPLTNPQLPPFRTFSLRAQVYPPDVFDDLKWTLSKDSAHFLDLPNSSTPLKYTTLTFPNRPDNVYELFLHTKNDDTAPTSVSIKISAAASKYERSFPFTILPVSIDSLSWPYNPDTTITLIYGDTISLQLTPHLPPGTQKKPGDFTQVDNFNWTWQPGSTNINNSNLYGGIIGEEGTPTRDQSPWEVQFSSPNPNYLPYAPKPLTKDSLVYVSVDFWNKYLPNSVSSLPLPVIITTADTAVQNLEMITTPFPPLKVNIPTKVQVKIIPKNPSPSSNKWAPIVVDILDPTSGLPSGVAKVTTPTYTRTDPGNTQIATFEVTALIPDTPFLLSIHLPKPDRNPTVLPLIHTPTTDPVFVDALNLYLTNPIYADSAFLPASIGDTLTFHVNYAPANTSRLKLKWSLQPEGFAELIPSENPDPLTRQIRLTEARPGTLRLYVAPEEGPKKGQYLDSFLIRSNPLPTFSQPTINNFDLILVPPTQGLDVSYADTITLRITPDNVPPQRILWSIEPPDAATFISPPEELERRLVVRKAGKDGTFTFKVQASVFQPETDGSFSGTREILFGVNKYIPINDIILDPSSRNGDTLTYIAALEPSEHTFNQLKWTLLPSDAASFIDPLPIQGANLLNNVRTLVIRKHNRDITLKVTDDSPYTKEPEPAFAFKTVYSSPKPNGISISVLDTLRLSGLPTQGDSLASGDILLLHAQTDPPAGITANFTWNIEPSNAAQWVEDNLSQSYPTRFLTIFRPCTITATATQSPSPSGTITFDKVKPGLDALQLLNPQGFHTQTISTLTSSYATDLSCKISEKYFGNPAGLHLIGTVLPKGIGFWKDEHGEYVDTLYLSADRDTSLSVCITQNTPVEFSLRDPASGAQAHFFFSQKISPTADAITAITLTPPSGIVGDTITLQAALSPEDAASLLRWEATTTNTPAFGLAFDTLYTSATRRFVVRDTGNYTISASLPNGNKKTAPFIAEGRRFNELAIINPFNPQKSSAKVNLGDSILLVAQVSPKNSKVNQVAWGGNNSDAFDLQRFNARENPFLSTIIVTDTTKEILIVASLDNDEAFFTINLQPPLDP